MSAVPHSNHHIVGTSGWQNHDSSPPAVCYYTALSWLPMSSIGAGLAPRRHDIRSKMAAPRLLIQDGGPHGVRYKMAAPRSQIQDGGPCDVFGYTSEGESTP